MSKRFLLYIAIMMLCLTNRGVFGAGMFHPCYQWYSIKTQHFWIHYHDGLQKQALHLAPIAEAVHETLTREIGLEPFFRTDVVLCDTTDMANGFSMPFPYNRIQLFIVLPHVEDAGLSNNDDWLRLVFTHEYTHILTVDMIGGLPEATRYTLGRACFPNLLMPLWAIEGYAVEQESKEKPWGRLHATYTMMVLRQEVYANNVKDISLASHFPREWPAGMVPYLYGGLFADYVSRNYQTNDFSALFKENADNVLPFLMEKNFNDVYNTGAIVLWKKWQEELHTAVHNAVDSITKRGLSSYERITSTGYHTSMPRYYGNDIVFATVTGKQKPALMLYSTATKQCKKLASVNDPQSISVAGKSIIVSDIEYYQSFNLFRDVFVYDTNYRQKTKGLRVQYIEALSNGYCAIVYSKGRYSLVRLNASFAINDYCIKDTPVQLAYLRVSPDSSQAVFSIVNKGCSNIALYDFKTRGVVLLTDDRYTDIHPAFHPDGKRIVFSSDRDGVFNLYEINLSNKKISRITNVIGGAFFPDISSDGNTIVFSSYEANGYNIALMPYTTTLSGELSPKPFTVPEEQLTDEHIGNPYNPLHSLIAPWWYPVWYTEELYTDKYDNHAGFLTSGNDTLYKHSYMLEIDYALTQQQMEVKADYIYSGFYPDMFVSYKDDSIGFDDTFPWDPPSNVHYLRRESEQKITSGFAVPFIKFYNYNQLLLYYTYEKTRIDEYYYTAGTQRYREVLAGGHVALIHDGTYVGSYSISPEDGMIVELYGDMYHTSVASDISYAKVRSGLYYFLRCFANDVLAFMLRGGYAHNAPKHLYPYTIGRYEKGKRHSVPNDEDAYSMRGFTKDEYYGNRLAVAIVEYRIPLVQKDMGYKLVPLLFRDLWLTPFAEYGNIWVGETDIHDFNYSFGSELHLRITAGYHVDIEGFLGVVKGYGDYGETQVYFGVATVFEGALKQHTIIRDAIYN